MLKENSIEKLKMESMVHLLNLLRETDGQASEWKIWFTLENVYRDFGAGIIWTTILAHRMAENPINHKMYEDSYQMLYPRNRKEILDSESHEQRMTIANNLYTDCLWVKKEREE